MESKRNSSGGLFRWLTLIVLLSAAGWIAYVAIADIEPPRRTIVETLDDATLYPSE